MRQDSSRRVLIFMAIALTFSTLIVAVTAFRPLPRFIWNASDSVPVGWYWIEIRQPKIGEIALVKPPDWVRLYASSRGYLPDDVWLLKPVFVSSGALVCRFGAYVFVDGNLVARAEKLDRQQRLLPVWKGCRTLKMHEVFLLAKPENSFDSRYFGAVTRSDIAGTAKQFYLSDFLNVVPIDRVKTSARCFKQQAYGRLGRDARGPAFRGECCCGCAGNPASPDAAFHRKRLLASFVVCFSVVEVVRISISFYRRSTWKMVMQSSLRLLM